MDPNTQEVAGAEEHIGDQPGVKEIAEPAGEAGQEASEVAGN